MAGDVGVEESIAVSHAGTARAAAPEPVLHEYGPNFSIRIGKQVASGPLKASVGFEALSPNERLGLEALKLRETPKYLSVDRPYDEEAWGKAAHTLHPFKRPFVQTDGDEGEGNADGSNRSALSGIARSASRSPRLAGRIAVGIIMVSGPRRLALTNAQQIRIVAKVQNALTWLGAQSPARDVTWVHDNQHVVVTAKPHRGPRGDGDREFEAFEKPWRDEALAQLGFGVGASGVRAYIRKLKQEKSAGMAYCAFFTHYPLNHFAYCTGPYLVMQHANDGYGPQNLDRVFAHESGHVFGAPDEYREADCNCGGHFGFFRKPNLNCESCAPHGGVKCIMNANSWKMCAITPYHLGYNGLPELPEA